LKEACERSEFIDIKLIRVFDVDFIKEFAERNPDVHIVHLVSLLYDYIPYGYMLYYYILYDYILYYCVQISVL